MLPELKVKPLRPGYRKIDCIVKWIALQGTQRLHEP